MKNGMMIIVAVLLVAAAFAGAASAASPGSYTAATWNAIPSYSTLDAGTYSITGYGTIEHKDSITIGTGKVVLDFSGYKGRFAGTIGTGFDGSLFGGVEIASGNTLEIVGLNMTSVTVSGSGSYIGGVIGTIYSGGTLNFTNCNLVNCSITSSNSDRVGGLLGGAQSSGNVNVENCKVSHCDIVSSSGYVGGLIGYATSADVSFVGCNVTNCTLACSSSTCVGGLSVPQAPRTLRCVELKTHR